MPNYARFFQNISSKHAKKINLIKDFSTGTAFVTSLLCGSEANRRHVQTFSNDYLLSTLSPEEKIRYKSDSKYREKMREETQQMYRICSNPFDI